MNEQPTYRQTLTQCQQHGRSPQQDRDNLVEEILTLAQYLHLNPEPGSIGLGALGGLSYCVQRLYEQFEATRPLERLAERYCEVELESYPDTQKMVNDMRMWAAKNGIVIRVIEIPVDGERSRFMFVSHMNQTSYDGQVFKEGEFVHIPNRFPPQFSFLLKGTHFERKTAP